MRSETEVKRELEEVREQRRLLSDRCVALSVELDDIRRWKRRQRPSADQLNAEHKAKFADLVVPGVFVRVVGARSYPWKYVEQVGDDAFIGKAVFTRRLTRNMLALGAPEILHHNVSTTMIGKIRELLTPEEFNERFGKPA